MSDFSPLSFFASLRPCVRLIAIVMVISIAFAGCNRVNTLTPDEVIDHKEEWLNKTITVRGIAGTSYLTCTEEYCGPDNPCCNACSGMLALYPDAGAFDRPCPGSVSACQGNGPLIVLAFPGGGRCSGDSCAIACEPLQLGERYLVTGLLEECSGTVPWCTMRVERFEHE